MCCEPRGDHHSPMGRFQSFGCCCVLHGHYHLTPEEENKMLESYKSNLEDEVSRVEARIQKIKK